MINAATTPARQSGVALIETLIAVVILAVGILGAVGLQMRAISALAESRSRVEATLAAEELLGLMWNDQANAIQYATPSGPRLIPWRDRLTFNIPGAIPTVRVVSVVAGSGAARQQITITITWPRRGVDDPGNPNRHQVVAHLEPAT